MVYQPEPLETIDGFNFRTAMGKTTLCVDSERIDEYMEYYRNHKFDRLGISPALGYKRKDIEFLRKYPFVTDLGIGCPWSGDFDFEPLRALKNLRTLGVGAALPLRMGEFPQLEEVRCDWHPKFDVAGCDRLQMLVLGKYKPKSRNLNDLPLLPSLRELELVQPLLTSLEGIQRFSSLVKVEIAYAPKLRDLTGLDQLPLLDNLECQKCSNVEWLPILGNLKTARDISLDGCGSLPSIQCLKQMPALESFYFINTNVVDGDLSPLMGLRWAGFTRKSHYSHTEKQIDAALRLKGGWAIPRFGETERRRLYRL
jgi:protein phosphatase 1 regulatory subunit 7